MLTFFVLYYNTLCVTLENLYYFECFHRLLFLSYFFKI